MEEHVPCIAILPYLHDDDLHTEDLIFSAGFVRHIGELVHLWRVHLLKKREATIDQKQQ
jgi:hypothetical protein